MCISPSVIATIFAQLLREIGINAITIDKRVLDNMPAVYRKLGEGMLHYVAISLMLGRVRVCLDEVLGIPIGFYKDVTLMGSVKKGYKSNAVIVKKNISCTNTDITEHLAKRLEYLLPKTPLFIIDLSLWEIHHEKEIPSLIKQLALSISTVRKWLTDLNLVFVSTPQEVKQKLQNLIPNISAYHSTADMYKTLDSNRTVLLDPYAEDCLSEDDIQKYDYFIIGGIIDKKYPRPFATYMIYKMHELDFVRKAIKLRNSTVGVPNELNKIIDIILSVRLGGIKLEKAVIQNMSKDDKVIRAIYDIEKSIRSGENIDVKDLTKLKEIYQLDEESMKKVLLSINKSKS